MKPDFKNSNVTIYNESVPIRHMDVSMGGGLEVTDHGWTDSKNRFWQETEGEQTARHGMATGPESKQCRTHATTDSYPQFFSHHEKLQETVHRILKNDTKITRHLVKHSLEEISDSLGEHHGMRIRRQA